MVKDTGALFRAGTATLCYKLVKSFKFVHFVATMKTCWSLFDYKHFIIINNNGDLIKKFQNFMQFEYKINGELGANCFYFEC